MIVKTNLDQLSREEREVHISYDEITKQWLVEASVGKYINKFRKMGWKEIRTLQYQDGRTAIAWFVAPEFALSIRKPVRKTQSEEQRKASSERMRAMRNKSVAQTGEVDYEE